MKECSSQEVTQLLHLWRRGDAAALDQLVPLVYDELHRRAHRYMQRERAGHVLQTTALVNEVYMHLIDAPKVNWQDRAHFFAISAKLMRQILVDYARAMDSRKRGGDYRQVLLDESSLVAERADADLVELDVALNSLAQLDPRKALVVELRFFGGLTLEETAEVLKVSADTVWRDWDMAKSWLYREMMDRAGRQR
ncbi:MAG: polymerase sigma factor [Acidobacteria bacterium]|nr:polymerase sigma factor [Acidobacteriota bacterium]